MGAYLSLLVVLAAGLYQMGASLWVSYSTVLTEAGFGCGNPQLLQPIPWARNMDS